MWFLNWYWWCSIGGVRIAKFLSYMLTHTQSNIHKNRYVILWHYALTVTGRHKLSLWSILHVKLVWLLCKLQELCGETKVTSRSNYFWSKSFRNSFRKFKILFIKSDIVPFKVLPIDCNALIPALDPALEIFLYWYSHRAVFDFSITSFRLLKHVPRNGFLTRSNRKKSVSQHFQDFHTIEAIFNAKFNTNSLLQIQLHF